MYTVLFWLSMQHMPAAALVHDIYMISWCTSEGYWCKSILVVFMICATQPKTCWMGMIWRHRAGPHAHDTRFVYLRIAGYQIRTILLWMATWMLELMYLCRSLTTPLFWIKHGDWSSPYYPTNNIFYLKQLKYDTLVRYLPNRADAGR